jgi:hypothetical protein
VNPTATGDSPGAIEAVSDVFAGREDVDFSVLTLFTQPSVPDVRAHLLGQDVLLVCGGSVGSLCWHVGGPTDSSATASTSSPMAWASCPIAMGL